MRERRRKTVVGLRHFNRSSKRRALWVRHGSGLARHEALIERFCRKTAREELIEQTQDRARRLGLLSDDRKATGSFGPSMTISAKAWLLPGASFCSVYHDGERVTEVSYNPWYH